MNWHDLAAFLVATALMVMSPGPNGLLIAKTAISTGRGAGFANIAGFFTAFYLHGALSIAGVSVILVQSAAAFAVMKYLGAAYLIWLGVKSLRAAILDRAAAVMRPAPQARSLGRAYGDGLLTNVLNPKVSMFYLAVFPQFVQGAASPMMTALLLITLHALVNLIWFGGMVLVMTHQGRKPRAVPQSVARILSGVTGVFFIGFGLMLTRLRAP